MLSLMLLLLLGYVLCSDRTHGLSWHAIRAVMQLLMTVEHCICV